MSTIREIASGGGLGVYDIAVPAAAADEEDDALDGCVIFEL